MVRNMMIPKNFRYEVVVDFIILLLIIIIIIIQYLDRFACSAG